MKIDLDWIQEELDSGRKVGLECVDEKGFLRDVDIDENYNYLVLQCGLIVERVLDDNVIIFKGGFMVQSNELKHFRIKRPNPTFNDLIDVAVQAYRDGVADTLEVGYADGIERVKLHVDGHTYSYYQCSVIEEHVKHIESLCTETFVIKDFSDTKRLKSGDSAILSNGEEVVFSNRNGADDSLWFEYDGCHSAIIPYISLKGATVTQQKGNRFGDYDGYVPSFFPDKHYGDYLILDIDLETGHILNWNKPTDEEIEELINGDNK